MGIGSSNFVSVCIRRNGQMGEDDGEFRAQAALQAAIRSTVSDYTPVNEYVSSIRLLLAPFALSKAVLAALRLPLTDPMADAGHLWEVFRCGSLCTD